MVSGGGGGGGGGLWGARAVVAGGWRRCRRRRRRWCARGACGWRPRRLWVRLCWQGLSAAASVRRPCAARRGGRGRRGGPRGAVQRRHRWPVACARGGPRSRWVRRGCAWRRVRTPPRSIGWVLAAMPRSVAASMGMSGLCVAACGDGEDGFVHHVHSAGVWQVPCGSTASVGDAFCATFSLTPTLASLCLSVGPLPCPTLLLPGVSDEEYARW